MPPSNPLQCLVQALRAAGVRVNDGTTAPLGFPVVLKLAAWPPVVVEVPEPGLVGLFSPTTLGVAIIDSTGRPRARWGLAERLAIFGSRESFSVSPVGALVEDALSGTDGTAFVDGYRFYVSAYVVGTTTEVVVVVADASEEAIAREVSKSHQTSTLALKRIGKALSSKQSVKSLAMPALHAVYSTYELSSAFLWVRTAEGQAMTLESNIGATRSRPEFQRLTEDTKCIAAMAAASHQTLRLDDVKESPLTAGFEAEVCPQNAGPATAIPLLSSSKLVGVLELVGKRGDRSFHENDDMFETIAEHLALAIHNAMMFEENERLAMYDPLTGIANHRTMQEFLAARISEAERNNERVGVVMVDVDHFRRFNEEEGHDSGDRVLQIVAKTLKAHVRNYDLAARYGGEEFTLVLANVDEQVVVEVAERVRKALESLHHESRSGEARAITASFGCAVYPAAARDAAGLLKAADQALYEAKRAGRNQTVLHQEGPKGRDLGDAA